MEGKLLQLGVNHCPDLPSAWSSFAAWCYKWGRKIVDASSQSGLLTDVDKFHFKKFKLLKRQLFFTILLLNFKTTFPLQVSDDLKVFIAVQILFLSYIVFNMS